ncbi:MAG TPA: pentapeptide repeat-containing protein [Candidatus Acidoferrales bacterium]
MELNVELNVEQMETEVEASLAPASETAVDEVVPVQDSERLEAPAATPSALQEILEQHRVWLQSNGGAGQQANLCRGIFTGADLTDVNLRDAVLHQAVLKGADLLLTDFQGASLLQADLQGANLLGARFQDANLQGANLEEATGLQGEQLAGANLFGAALPAHISVPAGLQHVRALARMCGWLIVSVAAVSALAWLRIMTTADVQLLTNAPVLPLLGLQNLLPLAPFYLCGPVVMLGLYFAFHLCLQRLWDTAAAQPAIFPDGRRLDACLPWFARWPARGRMKWLREHNPSLASLEAGISMLLLYWVVPATIVLFWARYLTLQDLRGTMLHVLLVVTAASAALYFTHAASRAYRRSSPSSGPGKYTWKGAAIIPGFGLVLVLLSFGAIRGVPHDDRRTPESNWGVQSWAADLLWWAGYTPTAQFAESDVSIKPLDWTGRDEDLLRVEGARLNGLRLRYIQAYGAFFAKAHLWQADLAHAYLSEADLRDANLRQADLQAAALDRARLNRAVLQEADLQGANLTQADLRDANLSRALLAGALLLDAKLDGANLYASDLRNAVLQRASLQHADLRDANLEGADLSMAILRQAYLSSAKMAGARLQAAQLAQAFLTQADLRRADLRGAGLQGAILNGANLTGANLQEVDLRGALGLTASQICSAASVRQIQLDETLQRDAESQCGLNR